MELLVLLSLCLLTFIGKTFGDDFVKIPVKESEDVILNCSFEKDITGHRIEWKKDDKDVFYFDFRKEDPTVEDPKFKDRVSRFSEDLKSGDASVKIKGAKVSDSGKYTCLHINQPGQAPVHQRLIELTVGTCLPPDIRVSGKKNGLRQVECKAVGAFPQPKMELKNNADLTVEPEDYKVSQNGTYFDITLLAMVTEEGFYHCVVTQEEICHQIKSEKTEVLMPAGPGYFLIPFIIVSFLLIITVTGILVYCFCCRSSSGSCMMKTRRNNPVDESNCQRDTSKTAVNNKLL